MEYTLDALVAGLLCLDITPKFNTTKCDNIGKILIPAKTLLMGEVEIHAGGCVTNTGIAMKKMGANVALVSKLGNDDFGQIMLDRIARHSDTSGILISEKGGTSYSIVLSPPGIDRIFLHHCGVNDEYGADDINMEMVKQARIFHFGYPPAMKRMYQNGGEELVRLYQNAKQTGTATSLDTTAVDEYSPAGQVDWANVLRKTAPYLDFFMPSVEELCFMLDRKMYAKWRAAAGERDIVTAINEDDVDSLAQRLLEFGAKVVLVKCGARGLYLATSDKDTLKNVGGDLAKNLIGWENVRHFEASYKPARVLSATGAGDTCIAAFLCSVLRGLPYKEAMQYATAAGASCVEEYDSLSGLRSFEEMKQKIADGWEKNDQNC